MGHFQTQNPDLGDFGGSCNGIFWYIARLFRLFCGYLVYYLRFGLLYQEKSGNPGPSSFMHFKFSTLTFLYGVSLLFLV
jgi:hypothetical protein